MRRGHPVLPGGYLGKKCAVIMALLTVFAYAYTYLRGPKYPHTWDWHTPDLDSGGAGYAKTAVLNQCFNSDQTCSIPEQIEV